MSAKLRWRRGEQILSWGYEYIAQAGDGWQYRVFPKSANWWCELERNVDHKPVPVKAVGRPRWRLNQAKAMAQLHYDATGGRP